MLTTFLRAVARVSFAPQVCQLIYLSLESFEPLRAKAKLLNDGAGIALGLV